MHCNILFIGVWICWTWEVVQAYSAFDCRGQGVWPTNTTDNDEVMPRFQNMLAAYENKCSLAPGDYWTTTLYGSGLGSGLTISIVNYLKAFELGKIYRPSSYWLWSADNSTELCNTKFHSIDCFNLPLSYCWYDTTFSQPPPNLHIDTADAFAFIPGPTDICNLAKASKKTIVWVMGQMFHYHMRLPREWDKRVKDHMELIFPKKKKKAAMVDPVTGMKCLTASIHVRGGTPDFSRKPFDGTDHVKALEDMNKRLKPKNSTICKVYVSGDHLEDTIFVPPQQKNGAVGNFSKAFTVRNGSFVFMSLPRYIAAPGELEHQVVAIRASKNVSMAYLYSEFVEDSLLHADADIFIGSHSNMFSVVAALRQAYHPNYANDRTCFLDSRYEPPPLNCLGSAQVYSFFRGALGGFNGGTIFFP